MKFCDQSDLVESMSQRRSRASLLGLPNKASHRGGGLVSSKHQNSSHELQWRLEGFCDVVEKGLDVCSASATGSR